MWSTGDPAGYPNSSAAGHRFGNPSHKQRCPPGLRHSTPISDLQGPVDVLDAQINDVQTTLARLILQRNEAVESVRQLRAIVSPVRRVPSDVLCEIFTLASTGTRSMAGDLDIVNPPPWTLAGICRHWRYAALSSPLLWSLIEISPFTAFSTDMIETQLSRSGSVPLDFFWWGINEVDSCALDLVIAQCSRWRTLRLKQLATLDFNWLHRTKGHLSQLERLEVLAICDAKFPDVFSTAPRLSRVILSDRNFRHRSPASIVLPMEQITHFCATYSAETQIEILNRLPALVECAIGLYRHGITNVEGVVDLPHLRRLDLEDTRLLIHLTTPILQELFLVGSALGMLPPFLFRSSCKLTKLVLTYVSLSPDIIPILQSLPTLAYLFLELRDTAEEPQTNFFKAMKTTGTASDICPNLGSILFGFAILGVYPTDALTMVQSRLQHRRLATFRVFGAGIRSPPSEVGEMLRVLRSEGLDAQFLPHRSQELRRAQQGF